jgi:hypothetical protein
MKRHLVHRFFDRWKTDQGHVLQVSLQDAPDISQEADFFPRRIAVVQKTPLAHPGTVIYGQDTAYLLVGQGVLQELMRFRAYRITDHVRWTRKSTQADPLTLMETNGAPQILNPRLPIVLEPLRLVDEQGFERPKYRVFTGADIKLGDRLGDYEVHTIVKTLGVLQLEVY